MGKLVMIDSNIFIWGIKEYATPGQEHKIPQAKAFITWLSTKDAKFLIPTPQLAELLSYVPLSEQGQIKALLDKRFRVVPFDEMAVSKCSELIYKTLNTSELIEYRKTNIVPKSKLKFDCMIVSIGITNRVDTIYSNDVDLLRFADNQIEVIDMPNIAPSLSQGILI